ncbi:MAG: hypothetical protein ABI612_17145 [Betaproteobacteria bacterium]
MIYNNTFVDAGQFVMLYGQNDAKKQSLGDSSYAGGDTGRMNFKNNLFFQNAPSNDYALLLAGPAGATIDVNHRSVRLQNNMYRFSAGQKIIWGNPDVIFGPPISAAVFARYQQSNAPDYPDTGSRLTTATWTQMFAGPRHRRSEMAISAGSLERRQWSPARGSAGILQRALERALQTYDRGLAQGTRSKPHVSGNGAATAAKCGSRGRQF